MTDSEDKVVPREREHAREWARSDKKGRNRGEGRTWAESRGTAGWNTRMFFAYQIAPANSGSAANKPFLIFTVVTTSKR